ncbi:MAG: hypothetical protein C4300_08865, partial [Thermus sp.]
PSPGEEVLNRLPEGARRVLKALKEAFPKGVYLVGGAVRDALGGFAPGPDVDLVLEGLKVEEAARFLVGRFGG